MSMKMVVGRAIELDHHQRVKTRRADGVQVHHRAEKISPFW